VNVLEKHVSGPVIASFRAIRGSKASIGINPVQFKQEMYAIRLLEARFTSSLHYDGPDAPVGRAAATTAATQASRSCSKLEKKESALQTAAILCRRVFQAKERGEAEGIPPLSTMRDMRWRSGGEWAIARVPGYKWAYRMDEEAERPSAAVFGMLCQVD